MAFFAVLAHPGTNAAAHSKRNQVINAIQDWISGWKKYQLNFQRISKRRLALLIEAGIRPRQTFKNDAVFRILTRAERIVVERRLLAAKLVEHVAGLHAARAFEGSKLRLRISGPQSLSSAVSFLAEQTTHGDTTTLWRIWRETLPVLHLVYAFHFLQPKRADDDRPDLLIRCIRDHRLWLRDTLVSAENRVAMLPLFTNFQPTQRVTLIPE